MGPILRRAALFVTITNILMIWSPSSGKSEIGCNDFDGKSMQINNVNAINLIEHGRNTSHHRAFVQGRVTSITQAGDHKRFIIQLGSDANKTLELVFNRAFGNPEPRIGQAVTACGDLIVARESTDRYLASPSGAILHWLHRSDRAHPDGFVKLGDQIFGDQEESEFTSDGLPSQIPVTRSKDVPPNAPCFAVDKRGIVKNPNYGKKIRLWDDIYGFISDGKNIYRVESPNDSHALLSREDTSIWRFFRENLARREYDGCGEPDKKATNPLSFEQIASAEPKFPSEIDTERFKVCFDVDQRGIVKNPNFGKRSAPFQKTYGFVVTPDGSIYGVPSPTSQTVRPYAQFISIEHVFEKEIKIPSPGHCLRAQRELTPSLVPAGTAPRAD